MQQTFRGDLSLLSDEISLFMGLWSLSSYEKLAVDCGGDNVVAAL